MARKCAGDWGARFLFLSLAGCHPDGGGQSVLEGAAIVREVLSATPVPVIVGGCGDEEVDARLFPAVAEAAGRPVFLSYAEEKNHRLVAGAALAYGHGVVAWSPIDINMAKQMNLLLADLGFPPSRPHRPADGRSRLRDGIHLHHRRADPACRPLRGCRARPPGAVPPRGRVEGAGGDRRVGRIRATSTRADADGRRRRVSRAWRQGPTCSSAATLRPWRACRGPRGADRDRHLQASAEDQLQEVRPADVPGLRDADRRREGVDRPLSSRLRRGEGEAVGRRRAAAAEGDDRNRGARGRPRRRDGPLPGPTSTTPPRSPFRSGTTRRTRSSPRGSRRSGACRSSGSASGSPSTSSPSAASRGTRAGTPARPPPRLRRRDFPSFSSPRRDRSRRRWRR